MRNLNTYLDCNKILIITKDNKRYEGRPIIVNYPDETESGEEEITIENTSWNPFSIIGFAQSEIKDIEVIE